MRSFLFYFKLNIDLLRENEKYLEVNGCCKVVTQQVITLKVHFKKFNFKPLRISVKLSIPTLMATAAVTPVYGKHSANYIINVDGWIQGFCVHLKY